MRRMTAVLALALLGGAAVAPALASQRADEEPRAAAAASYRPDAQECAFLDEINRFRRKRGKPELRLSAPLGAAAENHSEDMAKRNYFSHTVKGDNRSWAENIRAFGYRDKTISENIAAATNGETANVAMRMWVKSPPHRKTMLNGRFRALGVGRAYDKGSKYDWYWTTTFGGEVQDEVRC